MKVTDPKLIRQAICIAKRSSYDIKLQEQLRYYKCEWEKHKQQQIAALEQAQKDLLYSAVEPCQKQ